MLRLAMAAMAVCLLAGQASAQLFPNAPWNNRDSASSQSGGCYTDASGNTVCPSAIPVAPQPVPPMVVPPLAPNYSQSSYATSVQQNYVQNSGGCTGSAGSYYQSASSGGYGSAGSGLQVGGLDPQGYVITSVGSTISPQIACRCANCTCVNCTCNASGAQANGLAVESLAISDRMAFRRALLAAGRQARDSGEITSMEFFALSAASRSPRVLERMQAAVHEAAIEEGLATTQAIDWDSLIVFIEKLIPIIIKLIELFS